MSARARFSVNVLLAAPADAEETTQKFRQKRCNVMSLVIGCLLVVVGAVLLMFVTLALEVSLSSSSIRMQADLGQAAYRVDRTALPRQLATTLVAMNATDKETKAFVESSREEARTNRFILACKVA